MRIAAFQMEARSVDPRLNLARIRTATEKAVASGAQLLITPELALQGYGAGDDLRTLACPAGGEMIQELERIARINNIALLVGFVEAADNALYNSATFINGRDQPTIYRKSHLYGDFERGLFQPGDPVACLVEYCGLKIGFLICYDVEFPENIRRLAQAGAQLVAVPTALPVNGNPEFIARKMIPVRAFENQIFVAYVNYCGADKMFSYAGLSAIAAPNGQLLAEADGRSETLIFADISPEDFAEIAAANPYLRDLRV
ncbi:MAG: carbon-nitrogen hydrolase family protein [Hyphomicrobiaceae bacterium]